MNKLFFILNSKVRPIETSDLYNKIRRSLNRYLIFFDCISLIKDVDAFFFGGAVRDSIADLEIHDADILCLPHAFASISRKLESYSFKRLDKFNLDVGTLYKETIISQPVTYYRDNVFVQLIRPKLVPGASLKKENLINIAGQVDLSCCGVCFGEGTFFETCEHAVEHCLKKQFKRIQHNDLYNEKRIQHRVAKLIDRGWQEIK
jgi:hypothetical protein